MSLRPNSSDDMFGIQNAYKRAEVTAAHAGSGTDQVVIRNGALGLKVIFKKRF